MDNTTLFRRSSEILAALIVVVSTIVFLSTNTQQAGVTAHLTPITRLEAQQLYNTMAADYSADQKQEENVFSYNNPFPDTYPVENNTSEYTLDTPDAGAGTGETIPEALPALPVQVSEPVYQYVQVNELNLRSGPGSETEKLGTLLKGIRVQVLEQYGEWTKVMTPEDKEVYVFTEYIADTKPPVYNYVNVNLLNVRMGPGSDTEKLAAIERGSRIQVLEQQGEWIKVIAKDNLKGFVYAPYVVASESLVSRASTAQAYDAGTASSIIEYAKQFVGVPYVYGGESPKGFDCSGFTQYVYNKFKIALPRSADEYAGIGTKVSRTDLKPGDILLFDRYNNNRLGHVGIYLGGDQFIHASSSLKKVVIMSLSKYNGNYLGARRVIK